MAIAALAACVVINIAGPPEHEARRELIGHVSLFLAPMVLMPFLGVWFLASMPADSRSWVLGGSVTLTMFMAIGVGASLLIGAYALGAFWYWKLYINGFAAALLCAIAFAATAGGEFVREGVGNPTRFARSFIPTHCARMSSSGFEHPVRSPLIGRPGNVMAPPRERGDEYALPVWLSLADGPVSDAVRRHRGLLHGLHELRAGRSDRALDRLPVARGTAAG